MKRLTFLLLIILLGCSAIDKKDICARSCQSCNSLFSGELKEFSFNEEGQAYNGLLCTCKDTKGNIKTSELRGKRAIDQEGTGVETWETINCNVK